MSMKERLVDGVEVVRLDNGAVVHVVVIDPPVAESSHRVEKVMDGMLINMSDDFFVRERFVDA